MPNATLLFIHVLLVSLYVLFFIIKFLLLLSVNQNALINFRRRTKVLEMILPVLFIITGIILALKTDYTHQPWFMVKLVSLLLAIVLSIFTFKNNSILAGLAAIAVFAYIYLLSYTKSPALGPGKTNTGIQTGIIPKANSDTAENINTAF